MNWKYYYFDKVDSTNNLAAGYPVGSVIIANQQTAGRGRYGRKWVSLNGNLFLSAVLPDDENTPFLSFVIAVALAETLSENGYAIGIKWPNDILLDGGKVAGILLERTEKETVVVGIGVNKVSAPKKDMLYQTKELNTPLSNEELARQICEKISFYYQQLKAFGFEEIRQKWLKYALGLGQQIRVSLPNEIVFGVFEEITPQGAISLKQENGSIKLITVGDVFFEKEEK